MTSEKDHVDPWTASIALQDAASAQGFDWPNAQGVLDKIIEEAGEVREALAAHDMAQAQRELGDILLAAVNLSRFLGVSPSEALAGANERFRVRFDRVKAAAQAEGLDLRSCSLEALDALWARAKRHGTK